MELILLKAALLFYLLSTVAFLLPFLSRRALPRWLGPELARVRRRADLARIDLEQPLRRLLDWRQAAALD